eukprot:1273774-Karenia_brevis.AAC.1
MLGDTKNNMRHMYIVYNVLSLLRGGGQQDVVQQLGHASVVGLIGTREKQLSGPLESYERHGFQHFVAGYPAGGNACT